jgi:CheY-like chemotaxis protein
MCWIAGNGKRERGAGPVIVRPRLLALGAAECLFKPFSDDALLAALTKALG